MLLAAIVMAQLFSCKKKEKEEPEAVVPDAVITFISGEAEVLSGGTAREALIGEKVRPGDRVQTLDDSYLEILVDRSAVIRLESNTDFSIEKLSEKDGKTESGFSLLSGSVISKVEKIIGNDEFSIKTPTAAFGVRGTEFLVTSDNTASVVAVKSGSIKLVPYPELVEEIRKKSGGRYEDADSFADSIEKYFPLVRAGNELAFSVDGEALLFSSIKNVSEMIDQAKEGRITEESLAGEILNASASAAAEADRLGREIRAIDEANLEKLRITDTMEIRSAEEALKEIVIKTEPAGAAIYFDSSFVGFSSVSALLSPDRAVTVTVSAEGYVTFEKELLVSEITGKPLVITLEEQQPEKGYLEISARPAGSEISVTGRGSAAGSFRGSFDPGEKVSVAVSLSEYRTENLEFEIKEGETIRQRVSLELLTVPYVHDTGIVNPSVIAPAGGKYYSVVSAEGVFSVISSEGKTLYTAADAVSEPPVYAGGNIAYVTENSINAVSEDEWAGKGSIALESASYRKPVVYENEIFINSGGSVLKIDGKGFTVSRQVKVPDVIVSNPAFHNGKILTVTDRGVLQVFGEEDTPVSSIPVHMGNPDGMAVAAGGSAGFFASARGNIAAVDLESGTLLWTATFDPPPAGALPVAAAGEKWVAVFNGSSLAFFRQDGTLSGTAAGVSIFCPGGESVVYGASADGTITAYDPEKGAAVKRGETNTPLRSMVFSNNRIHAVSSDGKYLVINPDAFR